MDDNKEDRREEGERWGRKNKPEKKRKEGHISYIIQYSSNSSRGRTKKDINVKAQEKRSNWKRTLSGTGPIIIPLPLRKDATKHSKTASLRDPLQHTLYSSPEYLTEYTTC